MSYSIIVPVYNEKESINNIVESLDKTLKSTKYPFEIILIDDCSEDGSSELIKKNKKCRNIRNPENMGYGFSLKQGIKNAKYDNIIITDADMTYPTEAIPEMIESYESGFDMVVGKRTGKNYRQSLGKQTLRFCLRKLVEFTASRKIPDVNSGLRIFKKNIAVKYLDRLCNRFSFTTSLTLAFSMNGCFINYVDIAYNERKGKSKVKLFRDSFITLQYIIQAINYYNPIKIYLIFSLLCILLSIAGFTFTHITDWKVGYNLGIGGMLLSLVILCFGLIADLLRQNLNK